MTLTIKILSIFALLFQSVEAISVSKQEADAIAVKIWRNECAGSFEGLTTWNPGENFASCGIGHFIWYSSNNSGEPFQETFPELIKFIIAQGGDVPDWLTCAPLCPWTTREDFYRDINTEKMVKLRQFLFDTKDLQAIFIAKRLEKALPQLLEGCTTQEKERITIAFYKLSDTPRGLFALIDYINFKGLGISPKETYRGQAWGLRQVLLGMPTDPQDPVGAFIESAKNTLAERVKNSPAERNEERWLKGWTNRINSY